MPLRRCVTQTLCDLDTVGLNAILGRRSSTKDAFRFRCGPDETPMATEEGD